MMRDENEEEEEEEEEEVGVLVTIQITSNYTEQHSERARSPACPPAFLRTPRQRALMMAGCCRRARVITPPKATPNRSTNVARPPSLALSLARSLALRHIIELAIASDEIKVRSEYGARAARPWACRCTLLSRHERCRNTRNVSSRTHPLFIFCTRPVRLCRNSSYSSLLKQILNCCGGDGAAGEIMTR